MRPIGSSSRLYVAGETVPGGIASFDSVSDSSGFVTEPTLKTSATRPVPSSSACASEDRSDPGERHAEEAGSQLEYIQASFSLDRYMALSIKDPEADRLARELAARTGETLTEAVVKSLRERIARQRARSVPSRLAETLADIGKRCASLPVVDDRAPEEIVGYDEHGLPS